MAKEPGEPLRGDVIEGGVVHSYSWEWSDVSQRRGPGRLPWFGIFLVVFGALLLLQQLVPSLAAAGSILFLAVGVAFLVSWFFNRGTGSLYLGAIITALAAPDLLAAAHIVEGAGVGTLCLGVAFLFIALVRAVSHGGVGWQAWLGAILAIIGLSWLAIPGLSEIALPLLLVVLGVLVVTRSAGRRGW